MARYRNQGSTVSGTGPVINHQREYGEEIKYDQILESKRMGERERERGRTLDLV